MKSCLFLLLLIVVAPLVLHSSSQQTLGELYIDADQDTRELVSAAFYAGMSSTLAVIRAGATFDQLERVAVCTHRMSANQRTEVLLKYIRAYPEKWHDPDLLYMALMQACL